MGQAFRSMQDAEQTSHCSASAVGVRSASRSPGGAPAAAILVFPPDSLFRTVRREASDGLFAHRELAQTAALSRCRVAATWATGLWHCSTCG